jgi:hypothetical protein
MLRFFISAAHLLALVLATMVAFSPQPASAQSIAHPSTCPSDARFVRMLGVYPNATPASWQGEQVCLLSGDGLNDPITTATCQGFGQIAVFNGQRYCVWYHTQRLIAGVMYDSGTPPADDILFPTPVGASSEVFDNQHCSKAGPTRYVQTLGRWRGVSLCLWHGSGVGDPIAETACGYSTPPSFARVLRFGIDFGVTPPPSSTPPPFGTRYCAYVGGHQWAVRGQHAAIMAWQPTSICAEKYNDLNGNGRRDAGEPPLAGVALLLLKGSTVRPGVTAASGWICWEVSQPGTYSVQENVPAGWMNTDAPGGTTQGISKSIVVQAGQVGRLSFGNRLLTAADRRRICLQAYNDVNANGVRDAGEPPIPNLIVSVPQHQGATNSAGQVCFTVP